MSTSPDLIHLHRSLVLSVWVVLMFFTLLWLLSIILLLVLEAEGALTFEVADTITNVTLGFVSIAMHCLHGGATSRNAPE